MIFSEYSVMVIEDEDAIRNLLSDFVSSLGFKVFSAENGKDALTQISKRNIDIFIVDLLMPKVNGFDFIKSIRSIETYRNSPVIISTAVGQKESIMKAKEYNVREYIVKPISLKELERKLQLTVLDLKHQQYKKDNFYFDVSFLNGVIIVEMAGLLTQSFLKDYVELMTYMISLNKVPMHEFIFMFLEMERSPELRATITNMMTELNKMDTTEKIIAVVSTDKDTDTILEEQRGLFGYSIFHKFIDAYNFISKQNTGLKRIVRVPLESLKVNMPFPTRIYDYQGNVIKEKGEFLTPDEKEYLMDRMMYPMIYVEKSSVSSTTQGVGDNAKAFTDIMSSSMPSDFTILIVEPDSDQREEIKGILEKENFNIQLADSGTLALSKVKKYIPDVILSNESLPRMDGITFIQKLKDEFPFLKIPVIVMGKPENLESLSKALSAGAQDYLVYPIKEKNLYDKLKQVLKLEESVI